MLWKKSTYKPNLAKTILNWNLWRIEACDILKLVKNWNLWKIETCEKLELVKNWNILKVKFIEKYSWYYCRHLCTDIVDIIEDIVKTEASQAIEFDYNWTRSYEIVVVDSKLFAKLAVMDFLKTLFKFRSTRSPKLWAS